MAQASCPDSENESMRLQIYEKETKKKNIFAAENRFLGNTNDTKQHLFSYPISYASLSCHFISVFMAPPHMETFVSIILP